MIIGVATEQYSLVIGSEQCPLYYMRDSVALMLSVMTLSALTSAFFSHQNIQGSPLLYFGFVSCNSNCPMRGLSLTPQTACKMSAQTNSI